MQIYALKKFYILIIKNNKGSECNNTNYKNCSFAAYKSSKIERNILTTSNKSHNLFCGIFFIFSIYNNGNIVKLKIEITPKAILLSIWKK